MSTCTCGAVLNAGDPAHQEQVETLHLASGPHEDHRLLAPGETWPPQDAA